MGSARLMSTYDTIPFTPTQQTRVIIKTVDQVINSQITFEDDTELKVNLEANRIYIIEAIINFQTTTAADYAYKFVKPVGSTGEKIIDAWTSALPADTNPIDTQQIFSSGNFTSEFQTMMKIEMGAAGLLQYQFRQVISRVDDCKTLTGSRLLVYEGIAI